MKTFLRIVWLIFVIGCMTFILFSCDDNNSNDDDDDIAPTATPFPTATPTPPPADWCVEGPGDYLIWHDVGTSGAFHFEAKGFYPPEPGDWEKLVFFWMFNNPPGYYDYHNDGLLYEIRILQYYGEYPGKAGKIKGGNFGEYHEPYYGLIWNPDHWYTFDIEWNSNQIICSIDNDDIVVALTFRNGISGTVDAAIGWPWALRFGVAGLCYRNYGPVN